MTSFDIGVSVKWREDPGLLTGQGSVLLVDRTAGAPEGKPLGESPGYRLIAVERCCQSCGKCYAHGAGPIPRGAPRVRAGATSPGSFAWPKPKNPRGRRCPTNAEERWE